MRKFWVMGIALGFGACNLFTSPDKQTREIVQQEMQNIDWNDVDQYPLFAACDETAPKDAQRQCFEETLARHFTKALQDENLRYEKVLPDTVLIDFIVENDGSFTILNIRNEDVIDQRFPEFGERVRQCFLKIPRLEPALKRGIPVSAKFRIPVVVRTERQK